MQMTHRNRSGVSGISGISPMVRSALSAPFILLVLAMFPVNAQAHEFSVGNLVIEHPWSRATPPGAKVGGAYFTVTNNGKEPDQLVAATAEIAERAEFHRMTMKNDVMTMAKLDKPISIDPGETVYFEPGSLHMMLFGLKRPLVEGEKFSGTLTFEKAGNAQLSFKIDKLGTRLPSVFAGEEMDHSKMPQN